MTRTIQAGEPTQNIPSITVGPTPALVWPEQGKIPDSELQEALFREMALVERYDRHISREMHRALGALILMRDHGAESLAQVVGSNLGNRTRSGGE